MRMLSRGFSVATAVALAGAAGWAQQRNFDTPREGLQRTHVVVRVEGRENLQAGNLQVKVDGKAAPVSFVQPIAQSRVPVEVVIAVDDGLRNFGNNLESLKKLVNDLPPNASVAVGYMRNGQVMLNGGFVSREVAERSVRLPMGSPGASGSPYFTVSDIAKRWPSQRPAARFLLMVTNGIDPYNGRPTPMNQNSPYVDEAVSDAQKAGVAVYSIFWTGAFSSGGFASFSGQSYLTELSDSTGGDLLSGGISSAPTIDAYVEKFLRDIERSYIVGLDAPVNRRLVSLKVEAHGVKVRAPKMIRVGN